MVPSDGGNGEVMFTKVAMIRIFPLRVSSAGIETCFLLLGDTNEYTAPMLNYINIRFVAKILEISRISNIVTKILDLF